MTPLTGDGTWKLKVFIEGDDIIVKDTTATWFGGRNDPMDNGDTASGFSTRAHPECRGCALPMDGFPKVKSTLGSPIPRLPWLTLVEVRTRDGSHAITVPLIDLGPAKYAGDGIDLTLPAFLALGGERAMGVLAVDYTIKGGARFLKA